jgi:hypothetical protein
LTRSASISTICRFNDAMCLPRAHGGSAGTYDTRKGTLLLTLCETTK